MSPLKHIRHRLRRFLRDTNGSYSIETAMIVPLLLWGMLATYTFVDSYRMQALNLRATYTLSDLLTRQWNPVDGKFVTGLGRFYEYLTNDAHETAVRITVLYWDEPSQTHKLVWSQVRGDGPKAFRQADMAALSPSIPALANADSAIVVDTWMTYQPPFSVGIPVTQFNNRVVTSPRFLPQLQWSEGNPGDYINDQNHDDRNGDPDSI